MWLCVFFRAFVKCTFLCHSGIPADPLFHILWWKSWICMWKDIFSYKTIINQIDAHWIKRVLFSQLRSIMMICLLSVLFGLLETRSGGGSGGSCPVPSRELESQGLMLSHIQEERRRPRRCVSSARVSCVILFVTVSSFDDGWTSASDRRNIPVCQIWNYINASRDSCLLHLTRFQKNNKNRCDVTNIPAVIPDSWEIQRKGPNVLSHVSAHLPGEQTWNSEEEECFPFTNLTNLGKKKKILSPERLAGGNERGAAAVCTMRSLLMWANPTSNLWEGNLWQQANSSKKKQTFQPINGLIVWIKLKHYKDLLLGAPSIWLQEGEGAVGCLLTGAKLHPDVWNCSENVTAARAVISK